MFHGLCFVSLQVCAAVGVVAVDVVSLLFLSLFVISDGSVLDSYRIIS